MSVWQTPHATRRTSTSPAFGSASSTSCTASGAPKSSSTAARILMGAHDIVARMILVSDLGLPEAPVLLPDGGWLVTEMAPDRGCVTRFDADGGNRSVVARTGRPNGLAIDG